MDLKELEKKYNLDVNELAKILKKQRIILKLEHLNDIPVEWIPIIETSLGLVKSKKPIEKSNVNEIITLLKHRQLGLEKKEKEDVKSEEILFPVEQIKTEYQKLSGPQIFGDKIDLSQFKKPKNKNKVLRPNSKSIKNTGNGFYAYVKYVGPDFDHAFIKRIDDINCIASLDLRAKDDSDFTLKEDCSTLQREQIILCEVKSNKFHLAQIISETFEGTISKVSRSEQFIDWLSFKNPVVINNIRTFGLEPDDIFVATTLHFVSSRLRCKKADIEVNNENIISQMEKIIVPIISKSIISEKEETFIEFYKSNVESTIYDNLIVEQFEKELSNEQNFSNESNFLTFFNKWRILKLENLVLSNIKHIEHLDMYVKLWLDKKINKNFWENHLIDALINYEIKTYESSELNQLTFHDKLIGAHIEEISSAIDTYFQDDLVTDSIKVFNILEQLIEISNCSNKIAYKTQLKNSLALELAFDIWLQDDQVQFPKERAIAKFPDLTNENQQRVIELINDEELSGLISQVKTPITDAHLKRITNILNRQIRSVFNALSFDLETNTNNIFEIAWNNEDEWEFCNESRYIDEAINFFKDKILNGQNTIIGHNIISFDLPILEKYDISVSESNVWDTIQVESFLSPEYNNLALATVHSAQADAQLTLNLFFNQLLRILKRPKEELNYLYNFMSNDIIAKIDLCRETINIDFLNTKALKKEAEVFFRPQAKIHPIIKKLNDTLTTSNADNILILGSEGLRLDILKSVDVQFFEEIENEYEYQFASLDIERIKNANLSHWLKNCLKHYIDNAKQNNRKPYLGCLAPYIQAKVREELSDISLILNSKKGNSLENHDIIFATLDDLLNHAEELKSVEDLDIIVLQPNFISTSYKTKLGDFDLERLTAVSDNINHLWMKFSGGQSSVQLTKNEIDALQISCSSILTNFWIEKYRYGKYIVWGNYNWEELVDVIAPKKIFRLYLDEEFEGHTYFAKIKTSASDSNETIRFNPESIYRSRYWVYEKELINQISANDNPSILFIERKDEIEVLENYFRRLGFFIPDYTTATGRRLEFIHTNKSNKKIIISHISNLNKILQSNYLGALNIIIDSFSLGSNYFITKETSYAKRLIDVQQNKLDVDVKLKSLESEDFNTPSKPLLKDTFFLLKLLKPQISNYSIVINNYNSEHHLWLLDSRIADYPNLGELWNIKGRSLSVWSSKEAYEEDLRIASQCIPGVQLLDDLPFSIEETKAILSNVFLNGNKWYDYQEPYLDLIIPGKSDVLATLPTGGGKSLLFQAPALFKSSFTNRLTIVVTPLKALMEDQVDDLWNKGFYGSVEYLNSDRSTDTQIIYRAMAGGEIALLFVTPERFRSRSFKNALEMRMQSDGGLEYIVFDEAHCVSQWGHEFRPDYFNCAMEVKRIRAQQDIPLLLFSATVSGKIFQDFKYIFYD